jgi:(p)ppGpp synthase/HD superfamily hydrolase
MLPLVMAYSEAKLGNPIYSENLEDIGREHGLEGLMLRFAHALGRVGLADNELIKTTLALGVDLHEGDKRTHEPYIYHPVRVGIRLIEELGVTDPITIAGAPVHDTVEDHARELAEMLSAEIPDDQHLLRQMAHRALTGAVGSDTSDLVLEVSNPLLEPGDDKLYEYSWHNMRLVLHGSPRARALKLADVLDNTHAAKGENPDKRHRLDKKQLPIYGIHAAGLARSDSLVAPELKPALLTALSERHLRALSRVAERANAADHRHPVRESRHHDNRKSA